MSRADRYPMPSEQEFERVADRYIVVPAAIWAAAVLAAILSAWTDADVGSPSAAAPVPTAAAAVAAGD